MSSSSAPPDGDESTPDCVENWRKSSFSDQDQCVEVLISAATVQVRNTNDRRRPALMFDRFQWLHFVDAIRAGEFRSSTPDPSLRE